MLQLTLPIALLVIVQGILTPADRAAILTPPNLPQANCIPDGGSDSLCAYKVVPANGTISATAEEIDPFSNDPLGQPDITNPSGNLFIVCIQIMNTGGELSGPNGEVQTGAGEGNCIEVDLDITIGTPVSGSFSNPLGSVSLSMMREKTTTHSADFCAC